MIEDVKYTSEKREEVWDFAGLAVCKLVSSSAYA